MEIRKELVGRKYINLIRCSDDTQADTSTVDQLQVTTEFANHHQMVHANGPDVVLDGVSGSLPGARTDIQSIIDRKRAGEDFDVVLVQDFSRLTRGGIAHANNIKWSLAQVEVEVVYVTFASTGNAENDELIESIGHFASKHTAKIISYNVARGQASALANGYIAHTFRPPFGIDRLYVGADEKPRHRIRNLADGTQQMLAVESDVVLATYGKNPEKGAPLHYKRQSDERIRLIPGAPEHVEIVRELFRMRLVEGLGAHVIARSLNDRGLISPTNRRWTSDTVNDIVNNPTYTGTGIASRYATGIYNVRGAAATPQGQAQSMMVMASKKNRTAKLRPREEWTLQSHPFLQDYLNDNLRTLAHAHQEEHFIQQNEKALRPKLKRKPGGDKHVNSPYVLKGLLTSKQGGHKMTGQLSGRKVRYYMSNKGINAPKTGEVQRMIPAEPLECAVLSIVKEILLDERELRAAVMQGLNDRAATVDADRVQLQPLLQEQAELRDRLTDALMMKESTRKLIADKIAQWEARAEDLDARIAKVETNEGPAVLDVDAAVATVARKFRTMADALESMAPAATRAVLATLVGRLEVDLETREVEMDIALPEGMLLESAPTANEPVCLVSTRACSYPNETHRTDGLKIASVTCEGSRGDANTKPCFTCRRKAA